MSNELISQINEKINNEKIFEGTTVNERLYLSGLTEVFEKAKYENTEVAKLILEKLKVDKESIEKIIKDCR